MVLGDDSGRFGESRHVGVGLLHDRGVDGPHDLNGFLVCLVLGVEQAFEEAGGGHSCVEGDLEEGALGDGWHGGLDLVDAGGRFGDLGADQGAGFGEFPGFGGVSSCRGGRGLLRYAFPFALGFGGDEVAEVVERLFE
ncbi:hypothetical protein MPC38_08870 [Prescottella equi]|nr:hypothetical protein MPC38_08870 [Prescottella equi]